ncbi:MAG: hypothetical protein LKJ69_01455 [Lactobacillus sp.]|jgi:hypothetical protein|nr:hypothetical protein [Lactobacillus sp.]MCI2032050.1 hypothetical protein [Lactobacillus sp.]
MSKAQRQQREESADVMRWAHEYAHLIKSLVGDYQIAFGITLRLVWQYVNGHNAHVRMDVWMLDKLRPNDVAGVPAWVIEKDFRFRMDRKLVFFHTVSTEVVKETAKALQIQFNVYDPDDFDYKSTRTVWVAKSVMVKD